MSGSTPTVRVVRVRLDGQDDDAGAIAEILAQLLPEASEGRVQVGEISRAYPNRRDPGSRRYFELYLVGETSGAGQNGDAPGGDAGQPRELPGGSRRSIR